MSENEKRLREAFAHMSGPTAAMRTTLARELDALLAEHRAEVETLRRNLADAQMDAHENAEALSSARDAVLEEAKMVFRAKQNPVTWTEWDEVEDMLTAMKSQPARQFVDVDKVREVLDFITTEAGCFDVVRDAKRRLGIDLDVQGEHPDTQRHGAQVMRSVEHTVREYDTEKSGCWNCHHSAQQHGPKGARGADHCLCSGWAAP